MAANPEQTIHVYVQLAEAYHGKNRYQERDRFLILAADTAWTAGRTDEAEQLRKKILTNNPSRLLRPYNSFGEALNSPDIMTYIQQLRRGYPVDRATELLRGLESGTGRSTRSEEDFSIPIDPSTKVKPAPKPVINSWPDVAAAQQPVGRGQASRQDLGSIGAPPIENYGTLSANTSKPQLRPEPPPMTPAPRPVAAAPFALEPERVPGPTSPKPVILRSEPANRGEEEADEEIYASGAMVGGFLFLVVLLVGLGLFGYVFLWPFFQSPAG